MSRQQSRQIALVHCDRVRAYAHNFEELEDELLALRHVEAGLQHLRGRPEAEAVEELAESAERRARAQRRAVVRLCDQLLNLFDGRRLMSSIEH